MKTLQEKLRSQIGDDIQQVYDHEALFRFSADAIDELVDALEPFCGLRQSHHTKENYPDGTGIFGINDHTIFVDDLRRACAVIAKYKTGAK
jgi:hypothetical protein